MLGSLITMGWHPLEGLRHIFGEVQGPGPAPAPRVALLPEVDMRREPCLGLGVLVGPVWRGLTCLR